MAGIKRGVAEKGTWRVFTPINAVTATTTTTDIVIAGAKKITWVFTRADHTSGNTVYSVDVSLDGTTYIDFNMLVQNLARDAGIGNTGVDIGTTAVASVTLSSNTSETFSMDLEHGSYFSMSVTATETTDGTHTATCLIEF